MRPEFSNIGNRRQNINEDNKTYRTDTLHKHLIPTNFANYCSWPFLDSLFIYLISFKFKSLQHYAGLFDKA